MPVYDTRLPAFLVEQLPESPAGRALLLRAYAEAVAVHQDELRPDGHSRLEHVLGVAANVLRYRPADPTLVAAALLHDVVESGGATGTELAARYGPEVAHLVDAVTKREGEPNLPAVQRAHAAGRDALYLRLCDRLDGSQRSPGRTPPRADTFLRTTQTAHWPYAHAHFPALGEAMRRALTSARRRFSSGSS